MQVAGLLDLMGNLSLGNDNVTDGERAIFLQYLNLAHLELYQITASLNQDLLKKKTLSGSGFGINGVDLLGVPYLINSVYDLTHGCKLQRISLAEAIAKDPASSATGNPTHYYVQRDILLFVPAQKDVTKISIWYVPQAETLTEETEEKGIPYPATYHPVLVDGALYYLFQEEGGFKNLQKAQDAQGRWEIGKTRLLAYLYNSSGESFSTFSNV